jgi:hypothetical protein
MRFELSFADEIASSAMAAEAIVIFLDKKNQKSSHLPILLFRTRPLRCKPGSTTGCLDLRLGFARTCHRYKQI